MESRPIETVKSTGPKFSMDGGETWYAWERDITHFDDWRDTPFGRVNFGETRWSPQRLVRIEPDDDNQSITLEEFAENVLKPALTEFAELIHDDLSLIGE